MLESAASTYVIATAHAVPERVVSNASLTQFPEKMRPMIAVKTGISERRHADANVATSDLAVLAGAACLQNAGLTAADIGGIVIATCTPDKIMPPTAAIVHDGLHAPQHVFAFDVNAVCSSAIYAISAASGLVRDKPVLVIASDTTTKHLNPSDFGTYPYFGDGAGAILLSRSPKNAWAELRSEDTIMGCDGSGQHIIEIPAGGTRHPISANPDASQRFFQMQGKVVKEFALDKGSEMVRILAEKAGGLAHIHAVCLHQANINIIFGIADRTCIPRELFPYNLDRYGNTGGAGVLIALDELRSRGPIRSNTSVIMAVFGGGLAWAGCRLTAISAKPHPTGA